MSAFFDIVRANLAGSGLTQGQVDGINVLLAVTSKVTNNDRAYLLATAWHETAKTMQPIEEYGHGRNHAYGVPSGIWHQVYDGRGFVQLTWEANYVHATNRLRELKIIDSSIDLAKTPELAMRADIAGAVLLYGCQEGWFTGVKLADCHDFISMRKVVNGTDHAETIAGYATVFLQALIAEQAFVVSSTPEPPTPEPPTPTPAQPVPLPTSRPFPRIPYQPPTPTPPITLPGKPPASMTLQMVMGYVAAALFVLLSLAITHH